MTTSAQFEFVGLDYFSQQLLRETKISEVITSVHPCAVFPLATSSSLNRNSSEKPSRSLLLFTDVCIEVARRSRVSPALVADSLIAGQQNHETFSLSSAGDAGKGTPGRLCLELSEAGIRKVCEAHKPPSAGGRRVEIAIAPMIAGNPSSQNDRVEATATLQVQLAEYWGGGNSSVSRVTSLEELVGFGTEGEESQCRVVWLSPRSFKREEFRKVLSRLEAKHHRVALQCPTVAWLGEGDEWEGSSGEDPLAKLLYFAGGEEAAALDGAVPGLQESANTWWLLSSLLNRFQRDFAGYADAVQRYEQDPAGTVLELWGSLGRYDENSLTELPGEVTALVELVLLQPLFEQSAALAGNVVPFVQSLEFSGRLLCKWFNTPSLRQRLHSGALEPTDELGLLAGVVLLQRALRLASTD